MLNEIIIEGIVTGKQWRYSGHTFFRLASYREPARPEKPAPDHIEGHSDEPDYVTVRMVNGLVGGVPVTVEKGQRVRIHGYMASQDTHLTLANFLDDAKGKGKKPEVDEKYLDLFVETYRVDVVPERITLLNNSK